MEKSIAELIDEIRDKIRAEIGRVGGLARAAKLTPEQRSAISAKGSRARWRKYRAAQKKKRHPDPA